ncbi:hypothetical protein [Asticcacaulis machinosus]|uniref:Uncharacterized protein n=1 Tax=Asticcacaulis machinosus TaxID=2984211 RepID=A0ABT5HJ18_9CAUL|nr:hypothetical protein [Asticcacaulis machinosus]MDC7676234.1 hypothetical protein [Asticcacaulis machinosus]
MKTLWLRISIALNFILFGIIAAWAFAQYATYSHAHAAFSRFPDEGSRPAYHYDLFGDGTVIYQNTETSITYKIGRLEAIYALWLLDSPQFNHAPLVSSECSVINYSFGKITENGCSEPNAFTYDKIAEPLKPLVRAIKINWNDPEHAPTLTPAITAETYDITTARHKVDPPFWRPGPPPHDPNSPSPH